MGIRQKIQAHTSFITTANPTGGKWRDSRSISLGEVLIKEQLWDRQDYFAIFKDDETYEQRDTFSKKKIRLSQINLRPGHQLIQKYIHYIHTNPQFRQTKFNDDAQVERLRLFWNTVAKTYYDIMGNRSFETVFRTASAIARLILKTEVDSEVVDETIKFLTKMYQQISQTSIEFVDPAVTAYNTMCNVIKEYSQNQYWAKQNSPDGIQFADMTFTQAAEIAVRKNENIHKYLGDNFSGRTNRAAAHLRKMFRDRENQSFDGGKIIVTSKDIHAELTLRWNSDKDKAESISGITTNTSKTTQQAGNDDNSNSGLKDSPKGNVDSHNN